MCLRLVMTTITKVAHMILNCTQSSVPKDFEIVLLTKLCVSGLHEEKGLLPFARFVCFLETRQSPLLSFQHWHGRQLFALCFEWWLSQCCSFLTTLQTTELYPLRITDRHRCNLCSALVHTTSQLPWYQQLLMCATAIWYIRILLIIQRKIGKREQVIVE